VIAMPISFTSDVNPVTLVAVLTALVTVIRFWLSAYHIAEDARKEAEACMKCAKDAHHKVELLQAAIHRFSGMSVARTRSYTAHENSRPAISESGNP